MHWIEIDYCTPTRQCEEVLESGVNIKLKVMLLIVTRAVFTTQIVTPVVDVRHACSVGRLKTHCPEK